MLTREQFFACPPLPMEEVEVPALGGTVFVKMMNAGERDAFDVEQSRVGMRDLRARLTVACACDAERKPLFGLADVAALSLGSPEALDPIVKAAARINKLTDDDVDALQKNS
jgi:hypothetical protein